MSRTHQLVSMHRMSSNAGRQIGSIYDYFSIALLSGTLTPIFVTLSGGQSEGYSDSNTLKLAISILCYAVALQWIVRNDLAKVIRTSMANPIIFVILLLPVLSTFWSVDTSTTLRRSLAHCFTVVYCLYVLQSMTLDVFLRKLLVVLIVGGLVSIFYALIFPELGVTHGTNNIGAWSGIFGHKNELGKTATYAIFLAITFTPTNQGQILNRWVALAVFIPLLYLSDSKTNWVICTSGILVLMAVKFAASGRYSFGLKFLLIFSGLVAFLAILPFSYETILELLGRDETGSGRAALWREIERVRGDHYGIFGAGYGAFFTENGAIPALREALIYWGKIPNHAHNGYLNVFAELGWPAVFSLFVLLSQTILRVQALAKRTGESHWITLTMFIYAFLINNYSETGTFVHSSLPWVLVLLAYMYSGVALRSELIKVAVSRNQRWGRPFRTTRRAASY